MRVHIEKIGGPCLVNLRISADEVPAFTQCVNMSVEIYQGMVDDVIICVWGLIPPTLLSNQAYLWMYDTDAAQDHQFLFIRYSQRIVEKMLEEYETIVGHAHAENTRGIRWLKWLGAEFGHPLGKMIPFTIRKKHG